jgi:Xaa-Pro aminopeptidase
MLGAGRTVGALAFNVVKIRYKSPDEVRKLPSANLIVAEVVLQEGDALSVGYGHGIGHAMHEIPSKSRPTRIGTGKRLKSGLVIAIEPMVNAVAPDVNVMGDKWTAVTKDQTRSAHFEHSSAITDNGPWVSSRAFSQPGNPGNPADP